MTKDEVLKLALACVEAWDRGCDRDAYWRDIDECVAAIKEALAAPVQERGITRLFMVTTAYEQGVGKGHQAFNRKTEIENPYAPGECHEAWSLGYKEGEDQAAGMKQLAAQRQWVGLTDTDIGNEYVRFEIQGGFNRFEYAVRAIEAKLKEKNA